MLAPNRSASALHAVWFRLGAWCVAIAGAGHLTGMVFRLVSAKPEVEREAAFEHMRRAFVSVLGVESSLEQLHYGYSAIMAVMLLGFGAAILLIAKRSPSLLERGSALGWLCFALAATGFVISLAAFPTPPIALLGMATAAFGIGLRTAPPKTA